MVNSLQPHNYAPLESTLPSYEKVSSVVDMVEKYKPSTPVYCLHPKSIAANAQEFLHAFDGHVLYAVKCNPLPRVVQILHQQGITHYDTASLAEVDLIQSLYSDSTCYFMHPIKSRESIATAYARGVRHFVLDHPDELRKIGESIDIKDIVTYVRITPPTTTAVFDFSKKFGANITTAISLLKAIAEQGGKPALSFHIGSQCLDPEMFVKVMYNVKDILAASGVRIHALDVGGGFPAQYCDIVVPPLSTYFAKIKEGLSIVSLPPETPILCEPGRGLVATGMSLVMQVLLRKGDAIYINDSIYGSLSEVYFGKLSLPLKLIRLKGNKPSETMDNFTVYGLTCDSVDVLPTYFRLPSDVKEGDWIEMRQIGAYSNCLRSAFNGFYPQNFVEVVG